MGFEFVTSLMGVMRHSAAMVGLVLAGCTATGDAAQKADVPAAKELSAETFTTEGKPTKTLETPWGPREIYDPVQDPEVRAAFEDIRRKNYTSRAELYIQDGSKRYANIELDVLFLSREIHHLDVMRIGCSKLSSFDCGVNRHRSPVKSKDTCELSEILGKPRQLCEGSKYQEVSGAWIDVCGIRQDNRSHPNIFFQLVNEKANGRPDIPRPDSENEQLAIFYDFNCLEWQE